MDLSQTNLELPWLQSNIFFDLLIKRSSNQTSNIAFSALNSARFLSVILLSESVTTEKAFKAPIKPSEHITKAIKPSTRVKPDEGPAMR